MRLFLLSAAVTVACSAALFADDQIPGKALCSVCALKGGETESEKVRAHSEHEGKAYYFCSEDCKTEFDSDPVAYLPPILPRPAPPFAVEMLEGGEKTLADLRGKIVLVDFWATWCKPCLETMPWLQELHSAHADRGFEVLGVSIDDDKNRLKKIRKMVNKLGVTYPISLDAKQKPAWHLLKVKAIPAMYLLDREGQIVAQWTGKINESEVEKEVLTRLDQTVEVEAP